MSSETTLTGLIDSAYYSIMEKPNQVLEIFNDFFTEINVDMQNYPTLDEYRKWIRTSSIRSYTTKRKLAEPLNSSKRNLLDNSYKQLSDECLQEIFAAYTISVSKISEALFRNMCILVHFPHVTITNEHDKSVDINHLYAKINICTDGTMSGGFTLNRSEYSSLHLMNGYMH